jgi:ubiquinone/menaquinone biosynthesis C-methylase UbiE
VPNYDRVAPFYDLLASLVFGQKLTKAESHFYAQVKDPASILIFGGGTGKCLKPLQLHYPKATIHFLEASTKMISIASGRTIPNHKSVEFIHGNEQLLVNQPQQYDLVVTSFVLDVFSESRLRNAMDILYKVLRTAGYWIQTDFYVYQSNPWWQKALVRTMYWFFWITANQHNQQIADFDHHFKERSLALVAQKMFCHDMVKTVLYHKLQETDPSH